MPVSDDRVRALRPHALGVVSGGQQQRLVIARCLAVEPDVLLMDEPASALDPMSTSKIEDVMRELVPELTIVIVTHNLQQAGRIADYSAFLASADPLTLAYATNSVALCRWGRSATSARPTPTGSRSAAAT